MDKVKQLANLVSKATTFFHWSSKMSGPILTCFRILVTHSGLWGSVCLVNSGSLPLALILSRALPFALGGVSITVHTADVPRMQQRSMKPEI